ncbi:DEAD-box ATP-dependent RNA helicase 51-like protein [Tanacetum coccineum]
MIIGFNPTSQFHKIETQYYTTDGNVKLVVEELEVVVGEPGVEWFTVASLPAFVSLLAAIIDSSLHNFKITALFSATQTKKVEDLARLSFQKTPVYIDVDSGRSKREEFLLFWKENMFLELHEHVVVPGVELLNQLHFALQNGTATVLCLLCYAIGVAMAREFFNAARVLVMLGYSEIRENDHLAMSKLIASLTKGNVRSPLAQRLLTRYTSQVSQDMKVELMGKKWRFTNSFSCVDLISNGDFVGIISSDGNFKKTLQLFSDAMHNPSQPFGYLQAIISISSEEVSSNDSDIA